MQIYYRNIALASCYCDDG